MIEKEQREVERRPITKITHKGEIEIESDAPIKEPETMDTEVICSSCDIVSFMYSSFFFSKDLFGSGF